MLKPLGLYIHIPFCVRKCFYCDFNSFPCDGDMQERYIASFLREIDTIKDYAKEYYLDTIFIGGGTPSLLSEEQIQKLCNKIKVSFYIDDDVEWTIECNPGTVTLNKFRKYKELGINRVSMGVQSLDEAELKAIGRIHGLKEFMESYAAAKLAGFENINFDLIFSLPSQSVESFGDTAEKIMLYKPTHISAYSLQLEEGTTLYEMQDSLEFPTEEENREMYEKAKSVFEENGYIQYEISNFAKPGFESKHNLKYWSQDEYLGLGLGASSYFENCRYDNPDTFDEYISFTENKKVLHLESTRLTREEQMSEFMFMGLRKIKGVSDMVFKERFNTSFFEVFGDVINKHINNGLLVREDEIICLSQKGLDLANTVMCDFV